MKRTILLFFAIAGIISCTENDTIPKTQVDPIIGTWQLESVIIDGVNVIGECEMKSTLKFNQDGTFTGVSYITEPGKPCYEEDENSTWKNNNGETNYTIDGYIVEITFSKNNTIAAIRVTKDNPDHEGLFKGSLDSDKTITYKRK